MDGIALSFETYASGKRTFKIEGVCAAGMPRQALQHPDHCIEIMTGGALPEGADLIIPYEHLKIENETASVTVEVPRERFDSVHEQGSDFRTGALLLKAGASMNGPRWGIAASIGASRLPVVKRPKIKIISTGDELVPVDTFPLPHQVRRSNAYALQGSLLAHGFTEVSLDHVKDDYPSLLSHYESVSKDPGVLIYSGGVSKGKFDYLPEVWKAMNVQKHFHEVAQRPGKPLWFGTDPKRNVMVLGLPGNPISSLVCLHRYFLENPLKYARLTEEVRFSKPLTYFLPVRLKYAEDGVTLAHPMEVKNSGEFAGLAESDGFIELPAEGSHFKAGESYRIFEWGQA
jgi:molybdopterin molybdotransferase